MGFAIVGIPVDLIGQNGKVNQSVKKDALNIISKTGADYMHIVPTAEMFSGLLAHVSAVPATFFVDSEGNILGQMYLGARNKKAWKTLIDNFLAQAK